MAEKLHLGEFKIRPETEETVWMDRKRVTVFALPISFTIYRLSPSRINIQTGVLNTNEEEVMLYRVRDVSYSQGFFERLNGTGTVIITSTDATAPTVRLEHVKNARDVKELMIQLVEECRRKNRVRTAEVIDEDGCEDASDTDGENMV